MKIFLITCIILVLIVKILDDGFITEEEFSDKKNNQNDIFYRRDLELQIKEFDRMMEKSDNFIYSKGVIDGKFLMDTKTHFENLGFEVKTSYFPEHDIELNEIDTNKWAIEIIKLKQ